MKHSAWILLVSLAFPGAIRAQEDEPKPLINKDTQKAIDAGLSWLVKQQAKDGSFGTGQYQGNLAVASLAGLAIFARGKAPANKNFDKAIENAIRFVLAHEDKNQGYLHNAKAAFHGPMYGHGFAMQFLADAHEVQGDKALKAEVRRTLERAVALVVKAQNAQGGWRYQPVPTDADVSVTAVQVMALRAARDLGIKIPEATFQNAAAYIKRCQEPNSGGFRYQPFGGPPGYPRSAAALASLYRLGLTEGKEAAAAKAYLLKNDPAGAEAMLHYSYSLYFAGKAFWHASPKEFATWYERTNAELLKSQKDDHWTHAALCPHYTTAVALIVLQMPHGHLPSMKRPPVEAKKDAR